MGKEKWGGQGGDDASMTCSNGIRGGVLRTTKYSSYGAKRGYEDLCEMGFRIIVGRAHS